MRPLLAFSLLVLGCGKQPPTPAPATAGSGAAPLASAVAVPSAAGKGAACGALACMQYDTPVEAFAAVMHGDPLVLGIGEAHAPRGATAPSAAKRFTDEMLPTLQGRASDLLLELMMPPSGCAAAAAGARKNQEPVTSQHAENDQSEYVAMGDRARSLGIVPDMLRPSCGDMDAVRAAGEDMVDVSLRLIARLSAAQAGKLVDRDALSDADRGKVVLVYGGMLHNDLAPPPDRAAWSYAPALEAHAAGRFVALDLVVPEFIVDDDTWRSLPWYAVYDRAKLGGKTTLYRTADRSYVLVFPETR